MRSAFAGSASLCATVARSFIATQANTTQTAAAPNPYPLLEELTPKRVSWSGSRRRDVTFRQGRVLRQPARHVGL